MLSLEASLRARLGRSPGRRALRRPCSSTTIRPNTRSSGPCDVPSVLRSWSAWGSRWTKRLSCPSLDPPLRSLGRSASLSRPFARSSREDRPELRRAWVRTSGRRPVNRCSERHARFAEALRAEALVENPRSVSALARALGTTRGTLSKVNRPAVEDLLAARRKGGLTHPQIVAAIEAEAAAPEPRTVADLARALGTTSQRLSIVSRPGVERLLAARAGPSARDTRLLAALEAETTTPEPRSLSELARVLGTNHQKLRRLNPAAAARLAATRRGPVPGDDELLKALEEEALSPSPVRSVLWLVPLA